MAPAFEIEIKSQENLQTALKEFLGFFKNERLFLFNAEMAAGKTTMIKELCKLLGSTDDFSSPTYSIVNEYNYPGGKLFHFDLYRIKSIKELMDIGFDEYIHSNNYCFIEWPELSKQLITGPYVNIEVKVVENIRYFRAFKTL